VIHCTTAASLLGFITINNEGKIITVKTVTAKKTREQITCTGQSEGNIVFKNEVIGIMTSASDEKGKVLYKSEINNPLVIKVTAPKRNALLDKVSKSLANAINSGDWPS
jgi:hypothetical protein